MAISKKDHFLLFLISLSVSQSHSFWTQILYCLVDVFVLGLQLFYELFSVFGFQVHAHYHNEHHPHLVHFLDCLIVHILQTVCKQKLLRKFISIVVEASCYRLLKLSNSSQIFFGNQIIGFFKQVEMSIKLVFGLVELW